jgi:hypothetical protein
MDTINVEHRPALPAPEEGASHHSPSKEEKDRQRIQKIDALLSKKGRAALNLAKGIAVRDQEVDDTNFTRFVEHFEASLLAIDEFQKHSGRPIPDIQKDLDSHLEELRKFLTYGDGNQDLPLDPRSSERWDTVEQLLEAILSIEPWPGEVLREKNWKEGAKTVASETMKMVDDESRWIRKMLSKVPVVGGSIKKAPPAPKIAIKMTKESRNPLREKLEIIIHGLRDPDIDSVKVTMRNRIMKWAFGVSAASILGTGIFMNQETVSERASSFDVKSSGQTLYFEFPTDYHPGLGNRRIFWEANGLSGEISSLGKDNSSILPDGITGKVHISVQDEIEGHRVEVLAKEISL